MAISFPESRIAPLVEADPARKPVDPFARSPPAMETLEERRKTEGASPSAAPETMTVLGVEMVVKNTFLEVAEEEEGIAAKLQRCSTAPGSLAAWSQRCLPDGPEDGDIEAELSARGAPSAASHSWSGCDARRVAGYRRAAGEVSSDAIPKKYAQFGDEDDDQSPCSTTCTSYSTVTSWTPDSEEDYDYELAQFAPPRRLSIASFAMDAPVRAGGAAAPPTAAGASASAEGSAPQAASRWAPQIVTTVMVQNLKRNVTRDGFMHSLDSQGFAGKYDFVHLPKPFGRERNNGCAFVNFMEPEDAEEFARSIASIKGSKMRAVPAAVQGSANIEMASSRQKTRIRSDSYRPLVVGGHGQDVYLHA